MGKIREDLVGVVYVDGKPLKAGDDIPEGVELGDHLVAPKVQPKKDEAAPKPSSK